MMSHLGRPGGKRSAGLSLRPVAAALAARLARPVHFQHCAATPPPLAWPRSAGDEPALVLLENLRFHEGEEADDADFARALAAHGDLFVNDAFSVSHRCHASVSGIHAHFDASRTAAGFLIENELRALNALRVDPPRPFVAVLGGLKVSDKIGTIQALMKTADKVLIGGAMAYCFLRAAGHSVGDSPCFADE